MFLHSGKPISVRDGPQTENRKIKFEDVAFLFPKLTPEEKKLMMEEQLKKLEQEQQKAPEKK